MHELMTSVGCKATLAVVFLSAFACASTGGQSGDSVEATTGSRTGNPLDIRLTASGPELKAVIVNHSSTDRMLLHTLYLQASTLELVSSTGSQLKPYDSRLIMKYDGAPYCHLFQKLVPGKKVQLGAMRFRSSRDGFTGQWGPFNFDEVPAGDYQVRVTWYSDRAQCLDESTQKMQKVPAVWRGFVRSNLVTLHLP